MNGRVLLLNASEEILDLIPWQDAVTKLFQGKVRKPHGYEDYHEIRVARKGHPERYGKELREFVTPDGIFRLPTALILAEYVHVPHKSVAVTKENVLRRDSYECQYCGARLTSASGTIDHVIPTSKGGKHHWANVVAACRTCNNRKDNRTPDQAGMKLRCRPYVPSRDVLIIMATDLRSNKSWTRWIMT